MLMYLLLIVLTKDTIGQNLINLSKIEQSVFETIIDSSYLKISSFNLVDTSENIQLKKVIPDCTDFIYFKNNLTDTSFFKMLEEYIQYRKSINLYTIVYSKKKYTIPIEFTLINFKRHLDIEETPEMLLTCYCLPQEYPIGFSSIDGYIIIFNPHLYKINSNTIKDELYDSIYKYLNRTLGKEYKKIRVMLAVK